MYLVVGVELVVDARGEAVDLGVLDAVDDASSPLTRHVWDGKPLWEANAPESHRMAA
jgi:hypothetical protein